MDEVAGPPPLETETEAAAAVLVVPQDDDEYSQQMEEPDDSEEEEDECRVCRGGTEEDRPLFSPCKCSGSIGLVHQDCLTSWLAVTRGEGRCELCKVKFHFAPQYAENAPDQLSMSEVFLGLARRAVARWLPFLVRLTFCMSLWLIVAPLMTSYLYLVWMNRSFSCVIERWNWNLLPSDTVSGAILAAIILISFLSLMSFADFLRVEWQQQQQHQLPLNPHNPHQRVDPLDPDGRRQMRRELVDAAEANRRQQEEVDNELLERFNSEREKREKNERRDGKEKETNNTHPALEEDQNNATGATDRVDVNNNVNDDRNNGRDDGIPAEQNVQINNDDNGGDDDDNDDAGAGNPRDEELLRPARQQDPPPPPNPRPERPFDADANNFDLFQDDQVDMEINVALDELLGLRGPISSLVRNLLWLLVFNTVFLGFFAFVPKTIGSVVYSNILNTTILDNAVNLLPEVQAENQTTMSVKTIVAKINQESKEVNTIFRLPDFSAVNLGYLFCAMVVIMSRLGWILFQKCRRNKIEQGSPTARADLRNNDPLQERELDEAELNEPALDEAQRRAGLDNDPANPGITVSEAIGLVLDSTVAIVKVGILLFLKMFLLPVLLGIWLDRSSLELFGSNSDGRILYAGTDLFSFILLHWVCGITFMLLVTVSVLQLREVAHPDLLKNLIRPQEPQPNLLGNLMHESVLTQTKRMMLSLGIYTALLHLHVSIPVKILLSSGASSFMPFLKLRFWHLLMPRLQVPLELLVFHLTMLALLEKYKNSIGQMQHLWLKFVSSRMGLTRYLLPQEVSSFSLVGYIAVAKEEEEVNAMLYDLANGIGDSEELLLSSIVKAKQEKNERGETRTDGDRVLLVSQTYIALPAQTNPSNATNSEGVVLLPTKLGRFRLKRQANNVATDSKIEVWEEVAGKCVERPPENWDDLAAGDAEVQGRWAWGEEKQSAIEMGVAKRLNFYGPHGKSGLQLLLMVAKVVLLLFFSWCATTLLLVTTVSVPLGLGRLLFCVLRVPEHYIHDPLCFALGGILAVPLMAFGSSFLMPDDALTIFEKVRRWLGSARAPPARKLGVLTATAISWLVVCPLALGLNYELCLIKSPDWFSGKEVLIDMEGVAMSWVVGSVILNSWAILCSLSVFSKAFWVNFGNGMLEVDGEQNRRDRQQNADAEEGDQEGAEMPAWQGKDGRTGKFFNILKAALFNWEWDRIDHVALLVECAIPVSKNLGITLLVPSICYLFWFWSMDALVGLADLPGSHRLYIFRLATASTLSVQLCMAFRKQIQRWVVTIHKTARDDRYLIGEVLLNFQAEGALDL